VIVKPDTSSSTRHSCLPHPSPPPVLQFSALQHILKLLLPNRHLAIMAPHINETMNGAVQNVSHRRAKSNRVAPAIPYALVKPKPKQSSDVPIRTKKPNDSTPIVEAPLRQGPAKQPASPVANVPLTPTSVSSSHDKTLAGIVTPAESLSDRNAGIFMISLQQYYLLS
jgi:hypothetical protein